LGDTVTVTVTAAEKRPERRVVVFDCRCVNQNGDWGCMLSSGIADIVLALLLIAGWPSSASWALGLIVGVNLITSGVATIVVASAVRRAVR